MDAKNGRERIFKMAHIEKELKKFGFHKIFDSEGNLDAEKYKQAYANMIQDFYRIEIEAPRGRSYQEMFVAALENVQLMQSEYLSKASELYNNNQPIVSDAFLGGASMEDIKKLYRSEISTDVAIADAMAGMAKADKAVSIEQTPKRIDALLEISKIHDTRGFWWKVFHPIQNYREKKVISEIKNTIVTKHRGDVSDIGAGEKFLSDAFDPSVKVGKENSPLHAYFVRFAKRFSTKNNGELAILREQKEKIDRRCIDIVNEVKNDYNALKQREQKISDAIRQKESKRGIGVSYEDIRQDETNVHDRAVEDAKLLEDELKDFQGKNEPEAENNIIAEDNELENSEASVNGDEEEDIIADYLNALKEDDMRPEDVTDIESFAKYKGYEGVATQAQLEELYRRFLAERESGEPNKNNDVSDNSDRKNIEIDEAKHEVYGKNQSGEISSSNNSSFVSKDI